MASTGTQTEMRLAFGVLRSEPKDAPPTVLRQIDTEADALALSIEAGNHKLAYIAACIGKSESYVSRMATGKRPIPHKLVRPLCVATGSNLLEQVIRRERAMQGGRDFTRLAELMRGAA